MSKRILYIISFAFLVACTYPENDQRVSELEKEISELQEKLDTEQRQRTQAQSRENREVQQNKSGESRLLTPEQTRGLGDPPHLKPELGVLIDRREVITDSQFNQNVVLTLRNNYRKTVRSLRIRNEGNDKREYERSGRVNTRQGYEIVTVTIAPGQTGRVQLRGLGLGIYIEAVNFSDGTMAML